MHKIVFWTWCLPQTLLGALVFLAVKASGGVTSTHDYKGVTLVKTKNTKILGGLALGQFNFVTERRWKDGTVQHEYGHTRQGFILGPLYLLLVGAPSIFWLLLSHANPRIKKTYCERYPENWAEKLGRE
jgi:hypothetical protein